MKKILLSLVVIMTGCAAYAQVVCAGVSPAAIQGNYDFSVQAACGLWPGEVDDGTWGTWTGGLDFNNAGDHVQAELMLVEDGTPGTNPQGNPISQEGCNALTNSLTGKIAVVYRNTCWFSSKVYYAEQAGALAVIIVNREEGLTGMLGNTDPLNGPLGVDCHIPAVFLSKNDGDGIIAEMGNGPVTMFIGNKLGAFTNDVGAVKGEFLVPDYGGDLATIFDGFDVGIQAYNYGTSDQANVTVTATIDGPGGNVYDETVGPINMLSGDTAFIFPGNTLEFSAFDLGIGNYPAGDYTLTYDVDMGGTDDASFDNIYTVNFTINDEVISRSRLDGSNLPVANGYPSNSVTEYQSCNMFQEPNASLATQGMDMVSGMYFIPHADTANNDMAGAEIFGNVYLWDDAWVDLDDPNYQFDPAAADAFQNLTLQTFGTHYPAGNSEVDDVAFLSFQTPFQLADGQRYLICLQTFQPDLISFGYDTGINHDANQAIFRQPISPVLTDNGWFTGGWNGYSAPSIGLRIEEFNSIVENDGLKGMVYPNPANDNINVQVEASGDVQIVLTDISGKVVVNNNVTLVNSATEVNISDLDSGVYVLNVTLEDGRSLQLNVVKQ